MQALGKHILAEFYKCDSAVLNDVALIEKFMVDAAKKARATVISSSFHHFSPFGVSGVVVIAESHLTIHTWPEYGYASIDIYTCGNTLDPWISFKYLVKKLKAKDTSMMEIKRGLFDVEGTLKHKTEKTDNKEMVGV
ncbi:TPA: S-adenosylmethionine decarboxylase proenzyme [candidate division WOR-3 bacterium]|jgi:S-adenosylmethionine decarboxylase proenzyme|uniref:S-adenosylmethionine decarboxylase proenzyme n=1 Tax=candidate division WOR-3 bacterium TaxID=2052148 RepID=A0A350H7P8_UNCW3|nr:S-adenosylmethionine decarboxylase proenzyme [candidate division WOR-3 bacterium]